MIVKNEEIFLDTALKSVKSILGLDDLVVVDTGSVDRTGEIARENRAGVFDFKWCDDFSAARNFASDRAKNDWILFLDADEEVTELNSGIIESLLQNSHAAGMVSFLDLTHKTHMRLARVYNRAYYKFEGSIHEQLRRNDGISPLVTTNAGISIVHHGYLPEYNRVMGKLERNERLLLLELDNKPDDPYLLYQLGKSYFCEDRNLTKACDYFGKSLQKGADTKIGYTYDLIECYGYALINSGEYEKALALRNKFAESYVDSIQFRFLSAQIFQNNGMLIEAVDSYENCIGADVVDHKGITSFLSQYNVGVILECVGMLDDAMRMYEKCGDYEPARLRLADLAKD